MAATVNIGDIVVGKQGFGCMGISAFYGNPMNDADGAACIESVYKAEPTVPPRCDGSCRLRVAATNSPHSITPLSASGPMRPPSILHPAPCALQGWVISWVLICTRIYQRISAKLLILS